MKKIIKKYLRIYKLYFLQFMKSRLVYQGDTYISFFGRLIEVGFSIALLGLYFTQVDNIYGWTFNELLFLAGFGGIVMNLHHIFFLNIYKFGEKYVLTGKFDRFLLRPMNALFQVYADGVNDSNIPKLIGSIAMLVYASIQIPIELTLFKILYFIPAVISGMLIFGSIYLAFSAVAFWTGKSQQLVWAVFQISDFRRYPFGIYGTAVQALLVTFVPIAFATFFPATYFLERGQWGLWQIISLPAGPFFFLISYQFWKLGLSRYSSTGS